MSEEVRVSIALVQLRQLCRCEPHRDHLSWAAEVESRRPRPHQPLRRTPRRGRVLPGWLTESLRAGEAVSPALTSHPVTALAG